MRGNHRCRSLRKLSCRICSEPYVILLLGERGERSRLAFRASVGPMSADSAVSAILRASIAPSLFARAGGGGGLRRDHPPPPAGALGGRRRHPAGPAARVADSSIRIGPEFTAAFPALLAELKRAVTGAYGIPPILVAETVAGPSLRDGWRHFLSATIAPFLARVGAGASGDGRGTERGVARAWPVTWQARRSDTAY